MSLTYGHSSFGMAPLLGLLCLPGKLKQSKQTPICPCQYAEVPLDPRYWRRTSEHFSASVHTSLEAEAWDGAQEDSRCEGTGWGVLTEPLAVLPSAGSRLRVSRWGLGWTWDVGAVPAAGTQGRRGVQEPRWVPKGGPRPSACSDHGDSASRACSQKS